MAQKTKILYWILSVLALLLVGAIMAGNHNPSPSPNTWRSSLREHDKNSFSTKVILDHSNTLALPLDHGPILEGKTYLPEYWLNDSDINLKEATQPRKTFKVNILSSSEHLTDIVVSTFELDQDGTPVDHHTIDCTFTTSKEADCTLTVDKAGRYHMSYKSPYPVRCTLQFTEHKIKNPPYEQYRSTWLL